MISDRYGITAAHYPLDDNNEITRGEINVGKT